jgi:hypothetical protein
MEQESSRLAQLRQELENAHREEAELAAKLRHIHEAREALRAAPPPPAPPQPAEPIFLFLAWCLLGLRRFPFLSQSSCQVLRFTLPCLPCEW